MTPAWVPAGAWAAAKIGSRVFTNWTVMFFTACFLIVVLLVVGMAISLLQRAFRTCTSFLL